MFDCVLFFYVKKENIISLFIDYTKAFDHVDHNKLWEILKEMEVPDHLICILRNLCVGQEATVRTEHGPNIQSILWLCFQAYKP